MALDWISLVFISLLTSVYGFAQAIRTYLKSIKARPLLSTNDSLSPLRATLGCHSDVPDNVVEPPKYALLPPDLCNYLKVMSAVSNIQLLQSLLGCLSKQEGLSGEVNDMSKVPEASTAALLHIHL